MSTPAEADFDAMVAALRSAVTSGPGAADRPGQLRLRLESELGPEDHHRLRHLVHQVTAAAEENLPANLTRIAPLTVESLRRLSGELAESRGWSPDAAQRTTRIWAAALGFEDLVASSWPRVTPGRPQPQTPVGNILEPTAAPPLASPVTPRATRDPKREPASPPGPVTWPKPAKRLAAHSQTTGGEPSLGAVLGYAGMPLLLFSGLIVALVAVLVAPVIFLDAVGLLLPLLGVAVASVLVRFLGYGALVASRSGLEFTPYDGSMRKARPEKAIAVPWSEVSVRHGFVSAVHLGGRRIQVGPRNRAFVAAVSAYAGGGAA